MSLKSDGVINSNKTLFKFFKNQQSGKLHKKSNSTDQSMFFQDISQEKGESVMVSQELLYLNNKPKYSYLKEESRIKIRAAGDKSIFKRTNFHDKKAIHKIFGTDDPIRYKYSQYKNSKGGSTKRQDLFSSNNILSPEGYRNMIKGIVLRQGRGTSVKEHISYTHLSNMRNIQWVFPRSIYEGIKDTLDGFLKAIKHY